MNANDPISDSLARMLAAAKMRSEATLEFLKGLPESTQCPQHPQVILNIDLQATCQSRLEVPPRPSYERCAECAKEQALAIEGERLIVMGAPENLAHATLDNWIPQSGQDEAALNRCLEFLKLRRGFLMLFGGYGSGKGHLSVAMLRRFRSGWFVKHSELLRCLRDTYRDRAAFDPVDRAQDTGLLVLDEIGLSAGGRDELPLLHDILDYRHGNFLPTVITGNIAAKDLASIVGERMADRLRESAFAIINLAGPSHRSEAKKNYFDPSRN